MPDPLREPAHWLADARRALELATGTPIVGPVTVIVRDRHENRVSFTIAAAEVGEPPAVALSPLEERIVATVRAAGLLTAKAIAMRMGIFNDGGFRAILANLCERRPAVLASGHAGYRVVEPGHEEAMESTHG